MNFSEFLAKWNGKYLDFDGVYGNQCMDLLHQYCVEVLGLTDGSILAKDCAKNIWLDFENTKGHELFDKIANTPEGVPQEGDIMLWTNGTWGHVAIFIDGGVNTFNSFDQNYPTGSFCHVQSHNYTGVAGWLRIKAQQHMVQVPSQDFENLVRKSSAYDSICSKLNQPDNQTLILADIDHLMSLEQSVQEKDKQLYTANEKIKELDKQIAELTAQNEKAEKVNLELQTKVEEQGKTIDKSAKDLFDLQQALQSLKDQIKMPVLQGWRKIIYDLLIK